LDDQVIAVVRGGERPDGDAAIRHCAGAMAHFEVPKRVIFVDSLPKTRAKNCSSAILAVKPSTARSGRQWTGDLAIRLKLR
jgi:acyl-coenzyme A synthetase/AMP-(fatty) acid ligase